MSIFGQNYAVFTGDSIRFDQKYPIFTGYGSNPIRSTDVKLPITDWKLPIESVIGNFLKLPITDSVGNF